jgi:hypothetical protein
MDDKGGKVLRGKRPRIATSKTQDQWAQSILRELVDTKMTYSITYPNCRTFSENMYDLLKEHLPPEPAPTTQLIKAPDWAPGPSSGM